MYKHYDRYPKEVRKQVVEDILSGKLLVGEAMSRYGILSKRTIIRWLKQRSKEKEKTI